MSGRQIFGMDARVPHTRRKLSLLNIVLAVIGGHLKGALNIDSIVFCVEEGQKKAQGQGTKY
jgi:hypothetical protein